MNFRELADTLENLTKYKITQEELGKALGIKKSAVSLRMKNENSQLKKDEIEKISKYFNVSSHLIMWGSYKGSEKQQDDNFISIPVLGEVKASLGYGVTVYNENQTATYEISRKLARDLGISEVSTKMIFARGNSMSPTIESGDNLLVDMSKIEVYDGKIYCIRKDGQLYAKRLQKLSDNQLKIISDNKDYEPIIIDFSKNIDTDFAIIGEVRWAGRVFI